MHVPQNILLTNRLFNTRLVNKRLPRWALDVDAYGDKLLRNHGRDIAIIVLGADDKRGAEREWTGWKIGLWEMSLQEGRETVGRNLLVLRIAVGCDWNDLRVHHIVTKSPTPTLGEVITRYFERLGGLAEEPFVVWG